MESVLHLPVAVDVAGVRHRDVVDLVEALFLVKHEVRVVRGLLDRPRVCAVERRVGADVERRRGESRPRRQREPDRRRQCGDDRTPLHSPHLSPFLTSPSCLRELRSTGRQEPGSTRVALHSTRVQPMTVRIGFGEAFSPTACGRFGGIGAGDPVQPCRHVLVREVVVRVAGRSSPEDLVPARTAEEEHRVRTRATRKQIPGRVRLRGRAVRRVRLPVALRQRAAAVAMDDHMDRVRVSCERVQRIAVDGRRPCSRRRTSHSSRP